MFRYELNSIFRKHHFLDENNSEMFGGKHPLSKVGGSLLKDLPNEAKKEYIEMYRPPGIIKTVETNIGARPLIDEKIMFTVPTAKLFRRGKDNERKDDKYDRNLGGTIGSLAGNNNLLNPNMDMRGNNLYKKLEDVLYIHTKSENPNGLNF